MSKKSKLIEYHDANEDAMIDIDVANPLRMLSAYLIVAAIKRPPPEIHIIHFFLRKYIYVVSYLTGVPGT